MFVLTVANSGKVSSVPVVQFSISAFPDRKPAHAYVPVVKRVGGASHTTSTTGAAVRPVREVGQMPMHGG